MKLLQIVWNFPASVMHPFDMYYFYWPVREAVKRGWEAEVLTFQMNDRQLAEEVIDGIYIRRLPAGRRKGHPYSWAFIHALWTTDADIIHCHGYGEARSELAILIAYLRGRKVIFSPYFHAYPRRPLRKLYDMTLGSLFLNLSDRVIVFTEYTAQLLRTLGVHNERLRIVSLVARPEIFVQAPDKEQAREVLSAAGVQGDPLLLGVGQLIERKGWEYTLRCLPAIVERFPTAKLLIIGPSQPAEPFFRQRFLCLADKIGVRDHIQILQDNTAEFVRNAYCAATLLTHPSQVESFGMVLVEAMAAGVPIVAHQGTGMSCIVDEGKTGFVVDVCNTPVYTNALLALLNDPLVGQRMGAEGRRQASTRFSQNEVTEHLFAVYAEVINSTDEHDRATVTVTDAIPVLPRQKGDQDDA